MKNKVLYLEEIVGFIRKKDFNEAYIKVVELDNRQLIKCKCDGWGCRLCCSSEDEIRVKQGLFD